MIPSSSTVSLAGSMVLSSFRMNRDTRFRGAPTGSGVPKGQVDALPLSV